MSVAYSVSERKTRYARLSQLNTLGINPYPPTFGRSCTLRVVHINYGSVEDAGEAVHLKLCGRVINIHSRGNTLLITVEDRDADLEFVICNTFTKGSVEKFKAFVFQGDWVGFAVNRIFRAADGKLSAEVYNWQILALCLLPFSSDELPDSDTDYRLITGVRSRQHYIMDSYIVRSMRRFLEDEYDYLEAPIPKKNHPSPPQIVETHRQRILPEPQIATTHYLKQLIIGGLEAVYAITDEGWHRHHEPLDRCLHCYMAPADFSDMMELTWRLITSLVLDLSGTDQFEWRIDQSLAQDQTLKDFYDDLLMENNSELAHNTQVINLRPPWVQQSIFGMVQGVTGVDFLSLTSVDQAIAVARSLGLSIKSQQLSTTIGGIALYIFEKIIAPTLLQPTFVIDYPLEEYPLIKQHRHDIRLVEYFEAFIGGTKFVYGYTELNNPDERHSRYMRQVKQRRNHAEYNDDYIQTLKYGLPPTGGLVLSIDRVITMLAGIHTKFE